MIQGLILDMDGTLLDSHKIHLNAWKLLLRKYTIDKSDSEILAHFGKTTEDIAKELFPSNFNPAEIGAEKDAIFLSLITDLEPFLGVPELLLHLKKKNFKICIASSNPLATIRAICEKCRLVVDAYVGIDEIENGRPAPDMILTAASRLHLHPSACIVVGDSPYDIRAAKAANCRVIAVLTGDHPVESLEKENPDYIISSITEIEALLLNSHNF
ncbi:MAG: HAD family hydrolase [Candidatus Helarchaeota archaeon]